MVAVTLSSQRAGSKRSSIERRVERRLAAPPRFGLGSIGFGLADTLPLRLAAALRARAQPVSPAASRWVVGHDFNANGDMTAVVLAAPEGLRFWP